MFYVKSYLLIKKESVPKILAHSLYTYAKKALFDLNVLHHLCFLLGCGLRNDDCKETIGDVR